MTRTDVHAPTELVTEDYRFVATFDNVPPRSPGPGAAAFAYQAYEQAVTWWRDRHRELRELVSTSALAERGLYQCHHCGARFRYLAVIEHTPTGTHIAVGERCLDNRFELATAEFHKLRKAGKLDRERAKAREDAAAFLERIHGQQPAVHHAMHEDTDLEQLGLTEWGFDVVTDIRRRLWQWGAISVKQVELIDRLIREVGERAERQHERDAEVKADAPTGRVEFTGEVVSRKWRETDFGGSMKLVIKVTTDAGAWRVWVTEPSAIETEVGDIVRMTATLAQSDDDPSFAFGKRPTKATIVQEVAA